MRVRNFRIGMVIGMDYDVKVAKCGQIILRLNLCPDHGTITGKINIALDAGDADSIGNDLIHYASIAHEHLKKEASSGSRNRLERVAQNTSKSF